MTASRRAALKGCKVVALPVLSERFHILKAGQETIAAHVGNADIVHLMNHWTLLNAIVYRAARRFEKPYVVCPAGALAIFGRSRILKKVYNGVVGRDLIRRANAHIAIAANEIDQFAGYRVAPENVTTIPNGIDPDEYQTFDVAKFRESAGLGDAPYILFVGRLNLIKGPDLLLRAFCNIAPVYREYHLVLAGPDGGMKTLLKETSIRGGLRERVHFVGYVGGDAKAAAYRGASLVAIPSRQEAMSIVVLEAGICGRPVLMTDQCGFPELSRVDGGKIVAATEKGIEEGLQDMIRDVDGRESMGERLRRHVKKHYLWDVIAQRYNALFLKVLENSNSRYMKTGG
ncbi:MAG TPA: glycosyltransferase [Smithellaceae bacterium]|nr:glycosyltransferase [Smithellaceae bacterium]